MALKIVTGGTTGAADGTLVSEGNPIVFTSATAVDAHMRCDDGYWSADQDFDLPAQIEVSFDGGSTWYGNDDEPITAPEIYAVNYPIKLRQPEAVVGTLDSSFATDGSYTAIAALSTPTLTATVVDDDRIDLSWTNVSNEDASPGYTIERSPDGSSWSALTTKAANVTTHSDTGLSPSTHYYYRVKAEGSGRYSDSGWGTDDDTTSAPPAHRVDLMTDTDGTTLTAHSPTGGTGAWTKQYDGGAGGTPELRVKGNRVLPTLATGGPSSISVESWLSGSSNADCAAELDLHIYSVVSGAYTYVACRQSGASFAARNQYRVGLSDAGTLTLGKVVGGSFTSLGTYAVGTLTPGTTLTLRVEAIGTAIKAYVDGVQRISVTDSGVSAGGGLALGMTGPTATQYSDAGTGFGADAVRLYNT